MTTMTDTAKNVTRTLTWNEENRLKQTTDASGTNSIVTTYEYDAAGTRVLKKGKYGTVQYVSDNYTVRNKDLISKHVFAGNTRLVSKVILNEEKSGKMTATEQGSYYYHADHLGSSSVVTDGSGKYYEQIEYFPYGETWVHNKASSTQTSTPYKFTSKELDEETGLYYYGARYYDAKLSRWVSADDRFDDMFSTKGLDVFSYAHNNPIIYNDPTGHFIAEYADWMRGLASDSDKGAQGNGSNDNNQNNSPVDNNDRSAPIKQYDPKINTKDDLMKKKGCYVNALQNVAEDHVNKNMTANEKNDARHALTNDNSPLVNMPSVNGENMTVRDPERVVNDAFRRLGYPNLTASVGWDIRKTGKEPNSYIINSNTNPKNIRKRHYMRADKHKNLKYDPGDIKNTYSWEYYPVYIYDSNDKKE